MHGTLSNDHLKEDIRDYWSRRSQTFDLAFGHRIPEGPEFDAWAAAHNVDTSNWNGFACASINPGRTNDFLVDFSGTGTNLTPVSLTAKDMGFDSPSRTYAALDFFAEHPMHNGWYGKINYTLSRSRGNTEGQTLSAVAQTDVAATETWDHREIMEHASGLLPNDRRHQIKAFGSLKISDQFRMGGSVIVQSGRPVDCKSYWPYAKTGLYNNGFYYFYCGVPGAASGSTNPANAAPESATYYFSPRGSAGTTPWTATFNLNLTYTPTWLDGLSASVDVLNLFDTQTATAYNPRSANSRSTVDPTWQKVSYYTTPRSVRFTVRYDF